MHRPVTGLVRSENGAISILAAAFIVIFIILAALTVDVGHFIFTQRRLQAATDNAALAASFDPDQAEAIARASLDDNGFEDAEIQSVTTGTYSDDSSLAPGSRFIAAGSPADAVQLATTIAAPTFFSKSILGSSTITLSAQATAQNLPIAGFTALADIADLDANAISQNLTTVSGSPVSLSDTELDALGQTRISLTALAQSLADIQGTPNATVTSLFSGTVGLATLAQALYDALSDTAGSPLTTEELSALSALDRIASTTNNSNPINVGDLITLATHDARSVSSLTGGEADDEVQTLDALMAYSDAESGDKQLALPPQSVTVPGIGGVTIEMITARPSILGAPTRSPAAAVGPVGTSIYQTTTRLRMTVSVTLAGYGVTIPLILEMGYGDATLSSITCGSDIASTTQVGITAQSGLSTIYLGQVSNADFKDFSKPLAPSSVKLINVPVLTISGTSSSALQTSQEVLSFDRTDIAIGTTKSTGSLSTQSAATDLANNLSFSGTLGSILAPILKPLIATAIGSVASALPATLQINGVRLGYMDVTATSVRCGMPVLIE